MKEYKIRNQLQLIKLKNLASSNIEFFNQITEYFPLLVTITDISNVENDGNSGIRFCNSYVETICHQDHQFIMIDGWNYTKSIIHPDNLKYQQVLLKDYERIADKSNTVSYYQLIKPQKHEDYYWLHTEKTWLNDYQHIGIYYELPRLGDVYNSLHNILGNVCLDVYMFQKFQSLTLREKEILAQIIKGLTNNQIADRLFISSNTVRTHRNKIWNKLDIRHFKDCLDYSFFF